MRPYAQVSINGKTFGDGGDVRITNLSVSDQSGHENDRCSVTLLAEALNFNVERNDRMEVTMGWHDAPYSKDRMQGVRQYLGYYFLDEIVISWTPMMMTLVGHAESTASSYKEKKSRSWHGYTIGSIVSTIASEHNLIPRVDPELSSIEVPHRDQSWISDMSFMTKLAQEYGATAKPVEGNLMFVKKGSTLSVSRERVPDQTIYYTETTEGRFLTQSRARYTGVNALWHDPDTGEEKVVTAGDKRITDTLKFEFATEEEAMAAAVAKKEYYDRQGETLDFTCRGNPYLVSGGFVKLEGFDPNIRADWLIDRTVHTYSSGSYLTKVEMQVPESQADTKALLG